MSIATCACGASAHHSHSSAPKQRQVIAANRAHVYRSVNELAHDSTLVAEVSPTGQTVVQSIGGIPFTVATVTVKKVMKGSYAAGKTLRLRELGDEQTSGEGDPHLSKAQTYIAFMQPFVLHRGESTGQWVLTGAGAGVFSLSGQTVTRLDHDSTAIAPKIQVADLIKAIS